MEYIPFKTRRLDTPKDDLFEVLEGMVPQIENKDIILITSKVVAIHQGDCVHKDGVNKRELAISEAEQWIDGPGEFGETPIALKYNMVSYAAGIDESNSGDYFVLLPKDPFGATKRYYDFFREKTGHAELGVIITDSITMPLRSGAKSISIGYWGFHPVERHMGKKDLFGREMQFSSSNLVDAIAAGAGVVTGEAAESIPIVVARQVPNIAFTEEDTREELLMDPKNDLHREMLQVFFRDK